MRRTKQITWWWRIIEAGVKLLWIHRPFLVLSLKKPWKPETAFTGTSKQINHYTSCWSRLFKVDHMWHIRQKKNVKTDKKHWNVGICPALGHHLSVVRRESVQVIYIPNARVCRGCRNFTDLWFDAFLRSDRAQEYVTLAPEVVQRLTSMINHF